MAQVVSIIRFEKVTKNESLLSVLLRQLKWKRVIKTHLVSV